MPIDVMSAAAAQVASTPRVFTAMLRCSSKIGLMVHLVPPIVTEPERAPTGKASAWRANS